MMTLTLPRLAVLTVLSVCAMRVSAQESEKPTLSAQQPGSAEPALVTAQQDVDSGHFQEAEAGLKTYLASHPESAEGHALLGYVLFKENNPRASVDEYLESAKYRQLAALDLAAIGADYLLLEDSASADQWLEKAHGADPRNALTLYLWGRAKYNRQLFTEAVQRFEDCLVLEPNNARALDQLGLAYQQLGKTDEAESVFRRAIALGGSNADEAQARIDLGSLLVETGKSADAVAVLTEAVRMEPNDMRAHRELGKAFLRAGEPGKAQTELEAARQLDPQNAPTRFLLSQVYARVGRKEDAQKENDAYIRLSKQGSAPDDPLREARALTASGDLVNAERVARGYLETHRSSADAHYLLGYLLFRQKSAKASLAEYTEGAKYRTPSAADFETIAGDYVLFHDYSDAARWFAKAVELDPGNFQARYFLARAYYNENRFEEAVGAFEECLKLDPKSVKARDNLGLSFEGLGRTGEAEAAYRAAISSQSGTAERDPGPYINLGSLLITSGKPEEAARVLEEAVKLDNGSPVAHRELGKAYGYLNQLDKAQQQLEQAVALAPGTPIPHYLLAQVYRKRGLMDKAQAESDRYRTLVATHSSDADAPGAQARPNP
jgi:tetratricopeptide (TPR) repeat protein